MVFRKGRVSCTLFDNREVVYKNILYLIYVDIISWDSYPEWHTDDDVKTAYETAFYHDLHRSYKGGQPFYLIESSPSQTNWQEISRLKRPGVLKMAAMQAVAHGALGVNYFQWRQSRGGEEKFHGAVVSHRAGESSRVFQDVQEVGALLADLPELANARTKSRIAIIYDFENEWALSRAHLPRNSVKEYQEECIAFYSCFWRRGIHADVINTQQDLSGYEIVVAPMLYMLTVETARRLASFVSNGGILLTNYLTGWVDESDLVHPGGYPEPLGEVLGIRMTEFDTYASGQRAKIATVGGNSLGLVGKADVRRYGELLEPVTAEVLAVYAGDFYEGKAALTVNNFGKGQAYHIGAFLELASLDVFCRRLLRYRMIEPVIPGEIPYGLSVCVRETDTQKYLFIMNFTEHNQPFMLEEPGWEPVRKDDTDHEGWISAYGFKIFTFDK